MPLGVDGQQYEDEFHAIYSQINDPLPHITIRPKQDTPSLSGGSGDQLNSPGTPVPDSENNAPAGSVEPPRGLPDVEDRRNENYGDFTWANLADTIGQVGVDLGNGLFGPRSIPEAPVSPLSKALGHEDIKLGGELDSRSLLDRMYDDTTDGLSHISKAFGGGNLGSQQPLSEWGFSKGTAIGNKLTGSGGEERYQLWPERMIRSALSAAGDALQGKTPDWAIDAEGNVNTSIQTIEKAQDLANLAVLGPAPLAGKLADGTLGSFAGVRSKTLDKSALEVAQAAEKEGIKPDEIWQKTGFFRGADQRWRYEIDDSGLKYSPEKLRENVNMPLDHVLDHPELFKAYPELKDIKVRYDPKTEGASFTKIDNTINLGTKYKDRPDILMHEVQHAIQGHEGFAAGGSPGKNVVNYTLKYENEFQKAREEFHGLWKKINGSDNPWLDVSPEEMARYDFLHEVMRTYNKYAKAGDARAIENYMRLAGETEARNVETRLLLDPMQRAKYNPKTTQDYPDVSQIVSDVPIWTDPYTKP